MHNNDDFVFALPDLWSMVKAQTFRLLLVCYLVRQPRLNGFDLREILFALDHGHSSAHRKTLVKGIVFFFGSCSVV